MQPANGVMPAHLAALQQDELAGVLVQEFLAVVPVVESLFGCRSPPADHARHGIGVDGKEFRQGCLDLGLEGDLGEVVHALQVARGAELMADLENQATDASRGALA